MDERCRMGNKTKTTIEIVMLIIMLVAMIATSGKLIYASGEEFIEPASSAPVILSEDSEPIVPTEEMEPQEPVEQPAVEPQPVQANWASNAVVEALVFDNTTTLVPIDDIVTNLYRLSEDGSRVFISSKASGPGAYGPFGVYLPPPLGYANGWVGWNELPAGWGDMNYVDYLVELVVPDGYFSINGTERIGRVWSQSIEHPFCWWRFFYGGEAFTVQKYSSISGHKWEDTNKNSVVDDGELPLSNITIKLTGVNVDGETINMETVTAIDGHYSFEGLKAGEYVVTEICPIDMIPVSPITIAVGLAAGEDRVNVDFFNIKKSEPKPPIPPNLPEPPKPQEPSIPKDTVQVQSQPQPTTKTMLPYTGLNSIALVLVATIIMLLGFGLMFLGVLFMSERKLVPAEEWE